MVSLLENKSKQGIQNLNSIKYHVSRYRYISNIIFNRITIILTGLVIGMTGLFKQRNILFLKV